jgi:hypothetical protein
MTFDSVLNLEGKVIKGMRGLEADVFDWVFVTLTGY